MKSHEDQSALSRDRFSNEFVGQCEQKDMMIIRRIRCPIEAIVHDLTASLLAINDAVSKKNLLYFFKA